MLCLVPPELSCHRKERLWPQRIDLGLSNADMLSSSSRYLSFLLLDFVSRISHQALQLLTQAS
jgi:hypothetical protein